MQREGMMQPLSMKEILEHVANKHRVRPFDLKSARRSRDLVLARQVFCWLAVRHTYASLPEIGRFINRDHTTVMHSRDKIEGLIDAGEIAVPRPPNVLKARGCPHVTKPPVLIPAKAPASIRRRYSVSPFLAPYRPADTTAQLMGDPPPGRSALELEAAE